MSLFNLFDISGSAMTAQSQRLNVVASNLANADSATSSTGQPYRARQVVFSATPLGGNNGAAAGVRVTQVIDDPAPMKLMYDPKNPLADAKGYVTMPNVNAVEEMVNMISASRSYQSNADVMNTAKTLLQKTLQLGQ
ncbi:MAG: flagellar basal body rod protein FlgC [Gammaproteobacteria bacterium]|nr:flagellar basal body rod protein FlgC [Gammaproteobacteria bacterium]MBU1730954.1 flagellar basal body rod protein FlgC [Gammaproteobacteria bacterium]MBU1893614.1 flagellar basal body rod protein FlgC [Gammaproteobacteria bacterium]